MIYDERFFLWEDERELPEIVVSIPDALPRLLPAYSKGVYYRHVSCKDLVKQKPNYYGQHHWGQHDGSLRIYVNLDEYFNLFREMVFDNSAILRFKERFTKEYLENVVDDTSLENPADRIKLINHVFGVRDHDNWLIAFKCSDTEFDEWFKREVLRDYIPDEYEKTHGPRVVRWYTPVSYILAHPSKNSIKDMQFDGSGTHPEAKDDFPNGGNLDLLHFNEMKRVADVLKDNPVVIYFEIRLGVGTTIRPFFRR